MIIYLNNRQIDKLYKYMFFQLLYFLTFKCCICMIDFTEISVYLIFTYVGVLHVGSVIWTLSSGNKVKLTFTTEFFVIRFLDAFLRGRLDFNSDKVADNPLKCWIGTLFLELNIQQVALESFSLL